MMLSPISVIAASKTLAPNAISSRYPRYSLCIHPNPIRATNCSATCPCSPTRLSHNSLKKLAFCLWALRMNGLKNSRPSTGSPWNLGCANKMANQKLLELVSGFLPREKFELEPKNRGAHREREYC